MARLVRWQSKPGGAWHEGRAFGRGRDGSVTLIDERGRTRSIMPDRLQVQAVGPRGGKQWRPGYVLEVG